MGGVFSSPWRFRNSVSFPKETAVLFFANLSDHLSARVAACWTVDLESTQLLSQTLSTDVAALMRK